MTDNKKVSYIINIVLHAVILFAFLTIFFFKYVSKKEEESIKAGLDEFIDNETVPILEKLSEMSDKFNVPLFEEWDIIKDVGDRLMKTPDNQKIKDNNSRLKQISITVIIISILVLIGVVIYYTIVINKVDYSELKDIVLTTVVATVLMGILEYLFFVHIGSKYIHVNTSTMINAIIDRIKYHINRI